MWLAVRAGVLHCQRPSSVGMRSLAGYSCDSLPQAAILAAQVLSAELQEERWLLRHVGLVLLVGHDVKEDGHRRRSILQGTSTMLEVSPASAVQHSLDFGVSDKVSATCRVAQAANSASHLDSSTPRSSSCILEGHCSNEGMHKAGRARCSHGVCCSPLLPGAMQWCPPCPAAGLTPGYSSFQWELRYPAALPP